jgi:hypothetical protein
MICEVTVIVTGELPQSNTIVPPPAAACWRAAAVQLAGVPLPTTAVGMDTSLSAGRSHRATGMAASTSAGVCAATGATAARSACHQQRC